MSTYEILDLICDSVNPLLFFTSVGCLLWLAYKRSWSVLSIGLVSLSLGLVAVYGLLFFDEAYQLWPSFGLDYSTHTAFAFVCVFSLFQMTTQKMWYVVFSVYCLLMLIQQYHTFLDILSTFAVLSFLMLGIENGFKAVLKKPQRTSMSV